MTASRIRRARELAGLTLEQASRMIGLGTETISNIEIGNTEVSDEWMGRIAAAYRMSLEWLRGDPVVIPDSVTKMLGEANISQRDRDVVLEFAGMLGARTAVSTPPVTEPVTEPTASVTAKRAYVSRQRQTRDHHCHWPGCTAQVPPAMWGCKAHWFLLPKELRDRIWQTYVPGQEIDMTPSQAYLDVADDVQAWIKSHITETVK
jgi:transcriptional regulator with XRE-family HTH domain